MRAQKCGQGGQNRVTIRVWWTILVSRISVKPSPFPIEPNLKKYCVLFGISPENEFLKRTSLITIPIFNANNRCSKWYDLKISALLLDI